MYTFTFNIHKNSHTDFYDKIYKKYTIIFWIIINGINNALLIIFIIYSNLNGKIYCFYAYFVQKSVLVILYKFYEYSNYFSYIYTKFLKRVEIGRYSYYNTNRNKKCILRRDNNG